MEVNNHSESSILDQHQGPLLFYIIITPGSLRYLRFALWTLNKRNDFRIALVGNGLSNSEFKDLVLFSKGLGCASLRLDTATVVPHGEALNLLIKNHELPYFCFCDSDIISLDSKGQDIPLKATTIALSSCSAMFWDGDPVKGVLGRCNRWPDGSTNLSSFFCVYHTKTVKNLMRRYKAGFEKVRFKDIASEQLRVLLTEKGVRQKNRFLDTGKVLTAALDLEGFSYEHVEIPSLLHIGGLSSWMLNGDKKLRLSEYHLTDKDLYELADEESWLFNKTASEDIGNKTFYLRRQQRLAAARYCFQLIAHYVDKTPKPKISISNKELRSKISRIEEVLVSYYKELS